jgi:putative flippase GtrA
VNEAARPTLGESLDPVPRLRIGRRVASRWPGAWARSVRFARFGTVGASGLVVNELALAAFVSGLGVNYLVGAVLATQVSSLWNFTLVEHWAFRDTDARRSFLHRMGLFFAVNNAALLLRGPILVVLTSVLGLNYLVSNLVSLGVLTAARFGIADTWIWAGARVPAPDEA